MNLKCTKKNRITCDSLSLNLISMRNMRIVGNAIVFKIAIRTTSIAYVKPMSYKVCVAIAVVQEIAICLVHLNFYS